MLNHNESSTKSSSDINSIGSRVPNCKQRIESEDEMPGVEELQE